MIKAICFDLDGVYFTSAGFSTFKENLAKLGVDQTAIDYILHQEPMRKFKKGKIDEGIFWQNAIEYWKIDKSPQEIIDLLSQGYEIDPQIHSILEKVKAPGYKTCICSNNFVTRINQLEAKFNFLKDFDVAVFSYEVGVLKPDKRIFEELIKRAQVKPEEIIYSDDSEEKLAGALELDIQAFVYENFEQFQNKLIELGVQI